MSITQEIDFGGPIEVTTLSTNHKKLTAEAQELRYDFEYLQEMQDIDDEVQERRGNAGMSDYMHRSNVRRRRKYDITRRLMVLADELREMIHQEVDSKIFGLNSGDAN